MIAFIIPIVFIIVILLLSKVIKNANTKISQTKSSLGSFKITTGDNSNEKFIDKLPDDIKEKVLKGNVKIIDNVNKKVTRYQNGEKITEEETNSSNIIDKKAVQKCPNCGADLDLSLDKCSYCKTKIN